MKQHMALLIVLALIALASGCATPPASYSAADGALRPVNPDRYYTAEQLEGR